MSLARNFANLTILHKTINNAFNKSILNSSYVVRRNFLTSPQLNGLMEFFDDEKHWGKDEVKCGRSWRKEELRLKSNTDLHKLWYVLLKERNMLLTMEHECNENIRVFPSPERRDKVDESMENLETVVRERNVAYHQLETGETGERVTKEVVGPFGLPEQHTESEYLIPKHMNTEWLTKHNIKPNLKDQTEFLRQYKEKIYLEKRRQKTRDFNHVCGLLKRFPNMDMEAVKEKYPDVDIEKAKNSKRSRGHFVPE